MTKQIAVVTGAGSGIGAATARELGARGYYVIVTDVNLESAKKVALEIGSAEAAVLDVTDPQSSTNLVSIIVAKHGQIDVWVSNAGISKMQKFVDISPADMRKTFEVNIICCI